MEPAGTKHPGSGVETRMPELASLLRLVVITDRDLAHPRPVEEVVEAALRGGARAIQLRSKTPSLRETLVTARRLRDVTRAAGALLFINDRLDLALAASADGVHLGPEDLPVGEVRKAVPAAFLIGYSTDDPETAAMSFLRSASTPVNFSSSSRVSPKRSPRPEPSRRRW